MITRPGSEIPDFDAAAEWANAGMPEHVARESEVQRVIISCETEEDRDEVTAQIKERMGLMVRKRTRTVSSLWYPDRPRVKPTLVEFADGGNAADEPEADLSEVGGAR